MGINNNDNNLNYKDIIEQILELDKFITCVIIAKMGNGKIIATKYREGVPPLLSTEESELSVIQSLISTSMRKTLEHKLGKTIYSSTVYENETRASMYLFDGEIGRRKEDEYDDNAPILMITFDRTADHEQIIKSKILPFLKQKYRT